jgi:hypothetical protein
MLTWTIGPTVPLKIKLALKLLGMFIIWPWWLTVMTNRPCTMQSVCASSRSLMEGWYAPGEVKTQVFSHHTTATWRMRRKFGQQCENMLFCRYQCFQQPIILGELPIIDVNLHSKSSKEQICHYDSSFECTNSRVRIKIDHIRPNKRMGTLKATWDIPSWWNL